MPWSFFPFRSMHMHCISHPACHVMFCIMLLVHCTVIDCCSIACVLALGRAGRRVRYRGARWVCLWGSSQLWQLCRQDDHTLEITTIFAMLDCSLFCYAYATMPTTCLSCLPNCHVKPLTHHVLANRWLAMLPLCSAPLIALLVAGEDWRPFLVGTLFTCWDIIILSCYLNASIYLVKGGRLGLMPGVLFHSCCPSFRHIGVMFPDFAFLTRLGDNGNPLIVRLD